MDLNKRLTTDWTGCLLIFRIKGNLADFTVWKTGEIGDINTKV